VSDRLLADVVTVGELLEVLSQLSPDVPVVLSCDGEGNVYRPLVAVSDRVRYVPSSRERGDVVPCPEHMSAVDDMLLAGLSLSSAVDAVVLWPAG
jgi:hypothetical protein